MQAPTPKEYLAQLFSIFSLRSCVLAGLATVSAVGCAVMGWTADYPMALIGTAVIFPIVFAINSAYQRREQALGCYAEMKAHLRGLFLFMSEWDGPGRPDARLHAAPIHAVRGLITEPIGDLRANEVEVYASFTALSVHIGAMSKTCDAAPPISAAAHARLTTTMDAFEQLKHIFQYRTPRALQAFSDMFITVLPILYGPVFAGIALGMSPSVIAFAIPGLFAFVLSSLDNIQADLEDPFDGIGVDDIVISAEEFSASLARAAADLATLKQVAAMPRGQMGAQSAPAVSRPAAPPPTTANPYLAQRTA